MDELSGHLLEVEGEGVVNAEGDQDDELLVSGSSEKFVLSLLVHVITPFIHSVY